MHWYEILIFDNDEIFEIITIFANTNEDESTETSNSILHHLCDIIMIWQSKCSSTDKNCEELNDWLDVVDGHIDAQTIIIGDLNSNVNLDTAKRHKIRKAFANAIPKLESKGLTDIWHFYHKEEQGNESVPIFYLYRHLDKPLHIDHCFASPEVVNSFNIHARVKWLNLSDHLPVEIEVNDAYNTNPT